ATAARGAGTGGLLGRRDRRRGLRSGRRVQLRPTARTAAATRRPLRVLALGGPGLAPAAPLGAATATACTAAAGLAQVLDFLRVEPGTRALGARQNTLGA